MSYPSPVAGRVKELTKGQIADATERFGATESALVRMALEAFMPGYLAAQGRPENVEFYAKLAATLDGHPELKEQVEILMRRTLRRKAA